MTTLNIALTVSGVLNLFLLWQMVSWRKLAVNTHRAFEITSQRLDVSFNALILSNPEIEKEKLANGIMTIAEVPQVALREKLLTELLPTGKNQKVMGFHS